MQTFDTPAPITAVLAIPAGRVQFIATDRTDTTVEVRPANAAKERDVQVVEQTSVDFADGVLRIKTSAKNQRFGSSGSIEVTVQLPADSRVEATAASADFRVVGRAGDVAFEGSHGSISIDEAASVRLTTMAGDVEVGRLNGSGEIRTSKGEIRVVEAVSGQVGLRTEAGGITVGAAGGVSASLDAGTSSGRIVNSLKNDGAVGLAIRATTAYGDIEAHSL
ncbi:DUF4097 family beta strand repeat-containing protein [Cryptosporangium arvum]|uniref:DUF4097 family beta strand repeat-containing protein n=1 Tax=Cryptosporangium arvum TaxID=80871 RepID=UPI0004B9A380|nr:DUF4097 family beta strand repeat-containing protein [Cryptosporangium arvum]